MAMGQMMRFRHPVGVIIHIFAATFKPALRVREASYVVELFSSELNRLQREAGQLHNFGAEANKALGFVFLLRTSSLCGIYTQREIQV